MDDSRFINQPVTIYNRCLPNVPEPESGELFGSWVARVAVANGYDPSSLARWARYGSKSPNWLLMTPHSMVDQLAAATGMESSRLSALTFDPELESCTYPFAHSKDAGNWLIPLPDLEANRPSLTQICPDCLTSDRIPFLRKNWRFAFLTHCPIHRSPLLESCPDCDCALNLYEPTRQDVIRFQVGLFQRCPMCGFHLSGLSRAWAQTEPPSVQRAIHSTQQILQSLRDGWTSLPNGMDLPSHLFLPGLRILLRLLGSRFGLELRMVLEHAAQLEPFHRDLDRPVYFMNFESLPGPERVRLLALLDWIVEDWPGRWLEACSATRLRGSFVLEQKLSQVPFWLATTFCDPLLRLNHPKIASYENTSRFSGRGYGQPEVGLKANTFDRLAFITERTIWWNDLPQMALAMRDLGLYSPDQSLPQIESACRKYLTDIQNHQSFKHSGRRALRLSGYLMRRTMHRRLLLVLKRSLVVLLGLEG